MVNERYIINTRGGNVYTINYKCRNETVTKTIIYKYTSTC